METLKSLLIKVHNGQVSMDEAVEYAVKNITPVETHYNEDGVYLNVLEPDNAIRLIAPFPDIVDGVRMYESYDRDEYREFIKKYMDTRKELGLEEVR